MYSSSRIGIYLTTLRKKKIHMKRKRRLLLTILFLVGLHLSCLLFSIKIHAEETAIEKFSKRINVTSKKYGAKKGKDCTRAIQKALDDAAKKAKNKKRSLVTIPAGTYYISKPLQINSNVYLQCNKKTFIKKKTKKMSYMLRSKMKKKGKYDAVRNITVDGGTWDARYFKVKSHSGGSLFYFVHGQNLEFKNFTLKNCYGSHLLEIGGVKNVVVTGCKMYGFKGPKNVEKEAIQLDIPHNSTVMPNGQPFDDTPCANVLVENNEIHHYPRAVGTHTSVQGIYCNNITIKNNNFYDLSASAVYAYNYINVTVTNNIMNNVGDGVVLRSFTSGVEYTYQKRNKGIKAMKLKNNNYNLLVDGNTIKTVNKDVKKIDRMWGIFVYGTGKLPINNCVIQNNNIKSSSSAIFIKYTNNSLIANNQIKRLNNTGSNKDFVVDAIKLQYAKNNEIKSNVIYNNNGYRYEYGVGLRDDCKNAKIITNRIESVKITGIGVFFDSSADIIGNTIDKAKQHGISINSKSSSNIKGNNAIKSCGGHGVVATNQSNMNVMGNEMSDNGISGITLQGGSAGDLSNNTLYRNGKMGISISAKATVRSISNNKIINNLYKGIGILDSTVSIMNKNILSNPKCEKEITVSSSNTPMESRKPLTINKVAIGDTSITGDTQGLETFTAELDGKEYVGSVINRKYTIQVLPLMKGQEIKVMAKDRAENIIYTTIKV